MPLHHPDQNDASQLEQHNVALTEAESLPATTPVHPEAPSPRVRKPSFDDSAYGSYSSPLDLAEGSRQNTPQPSTRNAFPPDHHSSETVVAPEKPASWRSLPSKDQLFILTLARLAEPVVQTSIGAYMFFMLRSFDPSLSDAAISSQAGLLAGSFTFAQCLMAVWWGRLADKSWMGRKNVLIIGLVGTLFSSLGFGFSQSFSSAFFFRALGGALNGNVGVMRTMVSELVQEKKYQPKAFLMMPITFNVGVLVGPLLGGWLQDPVNTFPRVFGPDSVFGGPQGVTWMRKYPYALPNLVCAVALALSVLLVVLGLKETHIDRRHRSDWGRRLWQAIVRSYKLLRGHDETGGHEYFRLGEHEPEDLEMTAADPANDLTAASKKRPQLPYRQMFTRNVLLTFLSHGLLCSHLGAFNTVWFLFLSTPRADPGKDDGYQTRLPFHFSGGLGLPPPTIGFAIGILGALGLTLQFGVYSRITHWLGILGTYRRAMPLFSLAYLAAPYLAVLPTKSAPPHAADGFLVWLGICVVLFGVVMGRTFALPVSQILINNCTPHPSVLGSIHGFGTSVSAAGRTLGPVLWSVLYGLGLRHNIVGLAWWTLAVESLLAAVVAHFLYEGSGHEIRLEGDP